MKKRLTNIDLSLRVRLTVFKAMLVLSASFFLVSETRANELPSYCQNFPAVGGDIRTLKRNLQTRANRNNEDVVYTLCHEQETFPMKTVDLLSQWDQIERSMNSRGVKSFQEKLQEKVFRAIMKSTYDYLDLYDKDCSKVTSGSMFRRDSAARARCEEIKAISPQCGSGGSKFQRMMNEEYHLREQALNQEANQIINLSREVATANGRELVETESGQLLSKARESIEENKRENFQRNSLNVSLQAVTIHQKKQKEIHEFEQEKRRINQQLASYTYSAISYSPYGLGMPANRLVEQQKEQQEKTRELRQRLQQLETNHRLVVAELDVASAQLFEMNPTIFDQEESGLINRTVELVPSAFAKKIYDEAKKDTRISTITEPRSMADFLKNESSLPVLDELYAKIDPERNPSFAEAGSDKVFEELKKKVEALEEICKGDGSNLHHFPKMVEEVLAESLADSNQTFKDQAAYCYLLQTEPKKEGGSGVLIGIGATLLIAGTVVQVVPILGQVVGGSSLLVGGAIVAGASMLAYDSTDRYITSRNNDLSNQAVHQASSQWLGAEALLESRAKRSTQARIAFLEVATLPLDALVLAGPMARLMVKSGTVASRTTNAAPVATRVAQETTGNVHRITPIDHFFDLPVAQRNAQANEIIANIRSTRNISNADDYTKAFMQRGNFNPSTYGAAERELAEKILGAGSKDDAISLVRSYSAGRGADASADTTRRLEGFVNEIFPSSSTDLVVPGRQVALRSSTEVGQVVTPQTVRNVSSVADDVLPLGTDAQRLMLTNSSATSNVATAAGRGSGWSTRNRVIAGAAVVGAAILLDRSAGPVSSAEDEAPEEEAAEQAPEDSADPVTIEINITFVDGSGTLTIPTAQDKIDFEVKATVSTGATLPAGSWEVTCQTEDGQTDVCPETGFSADGPKQSVKLYENTKYILTFEYKATEPGFRSNKLNVPLLRICRESEGAGPAVNLCAPQDRTRNPSGATQEATEEIFWWEGLDPNMPPPPFTPGPPLKMRSFMLPGFI